MSFIFDQLDALYLHITCKLPLKCALNHLLKSCFFQPFTKARCILASSVFFVGGKQKEAIIIGVRVDGFNIIYYIQYCYFNKNFQPTESSNQLHTWHPPTPSRQQHLPDSICDFDISWFTLHRKTAAYRESNTTQESLRSSVTVEHGVYYGSYEVKIVNSGVRNVYVCIICAENAACHCMKIETEGGGVSQSSQRMWYWLFNVKELEFVGGIDLHIF